MKKMNVAPLLRPAKRCRPLLRQVSAVVSACRAAVQRGGAQVSACRAAVQRGGALLCSVLLLAAGCERRPLEVYDRGVARLSIDIDWQQHFGYDPSGITLLVYENDGQTLVRDVISNDVNHQDVFLYPGTYRIIIFSYSQDEYSSMHFNQLGDFFNAEARSNILRSHTLQPWEHDATYLYDPEDIGVATDTIVITDDMVRNELKFADYRDRHNLHPDTTLITFHEVPDPMTVTLYIKAKVKRRQSVKAIDASITGMAEGFMLSQIRRTTESGTLYLDNWRMQKYGDEADSLGLITTQIQSFGLPFGKELSRQRDSLDNVLTFHLTLTDGDVQDCSFNVGKDMRYIFPSGKEAEIRWREDLYDLRLEIDLSDVIVAPPKPPVNVGAGFDAWVDPWEDGGTIEFGM